MVAIKCQACGSDNRADAVFCYSCGVRLAPAGAPAPAAPASPAAAVGVSPVPGMPIAVARPAPPEPKASPQRSPVKIFWIQTAIGILVVLIVLSAGMYGLYALTPDVFEGIRFSFLTGYEEVSAGRRVSARETDRLKVAAVVFPRPILDSDAIDTTTVDALLARKARDKNAMVRVQGMVTRKARVENLMEKDWPAADVLEVRGAERSLLVLYRGSTGSIHTGDLVQVDGQYVEDEQVIHATRVLSTGTPPALWVGSHIWLLRAAALTAVWAVFCVGVNLWRMRRWQIFRAALLLAATLTFTAGLSGCTIHIITSVAPDGSGSVKTVIIETSENMNFLRQVPGMVAYLDALKQDLRAQGMLITTTAAAGQETILLQRAYGSLNEFEQGAGTSSSPSWVRVEQYQDGAETVYRLSALVDTRTFYQQQTGMNSSAFSYMTQQFDQIAMRYTVNLPGEMVYHNGESARGSHATWVLRMNDLNQVVAESRVRSAAAPSWKLPDPVWVLLGILIVFFSSTIMLLISLFRFHLPKGRPQ